MPYNAAMGWFRITRWSLIVAAAGLSAEADAALAEFYKISRRPVYEFVHEYLRRSERGPDDAEDLTQSFFAFLLERKKDLTNVHPQRGRFRSWLLRAVE